MLLFSKSFDDEPLEETIDDNSEMFMLLPAFAVLKLIPEHAWKKCWIRYKIHLAT